MKILKKIGFWQRFLQFFQDLKERLLTKSDIKGYQQESN